MSEGERHDREPGEPSVEEHIDLDTLDKYLRGTLSWRKAGAVQRHIKACPSCGLELKRLRRFQEIDSDEELARNGEWLYARTRLEKALGERIIPGAARSKARVIRLTRAVRVARWLVPAAAAAAAVIIALRFSSEVPVPPSSEPAKSVMRGAPPLAYRIELVEPMGEIAAPPVVFRWKSERKDDRFTLEIFTPKLDRVAFQTDIKESSWAPPDSIKSTLEPGAVYLWYVRGYRGLERATTSPNGWFKIKP